VRYLQIYLTQKEKDNFELALKLCADNVINVPGGPFEESDAFELNALANENVFSFVRYKLEGVHKGLRVYKTRMV
jgi:hypothetical protein